MPICEYCRGTFDNLNNGIYHDAGCEVEDKLKIANAKVPPKKKVAPVVHSEILTPDKPSESLMDAKKKRKPGRPKKVVSDE